MKNVLLHQRAIFQLTLWNWLFLGIVGQFPAASFHLVDWSDGFWCQMLLCTWCPPPLCSKVWEHPECNKHPLTTSLGICHSLSHRITVYKPCPSIWEKAWNIPNHFYCRISIILHPDGCRLQHFAVKELIEKSSCSSGWHLPPVSALSNTEGVDREESVWVPFLLSVIGSIAIGNLIKCLFAWGDTNHVSCKLAVPHHWNIGVHWPQPLLKSSVVSPESVQSIYPAGKPFHNVLSCHTLCK